MTARFAIRLALVAAVVWPAFPLAQTAARCSVAGGITSARIPLPGVVVTLVGPDQTVVAVTSTGPDGAYSLRVPASGGYTIKAELTAFAPLSRDLTVDGSACPVTEDLAMTLASRASVTGASGRPPGASTSAPLAARGAGRGQARAPQQFQTLQLLADPAALARGDDSGASDGGAAQIVLPPGFLPDAAAESVTATGTAQQNDLFFGPNGAGDFAQRFGFFDGPGGPAAGIAAGGAARTGGPGAFGPGGPGAFGGGPAFGGPFGRGGRGGQQIRGSVFHSFDSSALDTAPYALNGQPTTKPEYLQQRFGVTVGGPLTIRKVVNSPRTFFFLNYSGNHSSNPYDAYSTVPTLAERAGDFSTLARPIVDPATGQAFANNQIPASRLDAASQQLLALFPAPNQAGVTQNFHNVTTVTNHTDDVNVRLVRVFGATPQGRGQPGGGRGFGGRGGGGRQGAANLNVTIHYRHADNASANALPTLGGESKTNAFDIPGTFSFTKAGLSNAVRFGMNRQHVESTNLFANSQNVAGDAGLLGISTEPIDWGAPNLSFSHFQNVRDVNATDRIDRTLSVGDTITKTRNRHTFRVGGDLRAIRSDSRTAQNARGSYVFTGIYSGYDFADFLLGLPQQASVQPGHPVDFEQTTGDLFAQDDWRVTDRLTLNAGLRYEYYSPLTEENGRLVTLDVAPGFTAAVPVQAGGTGPYSGALPESLVNPYRKGFAPRVGLAWRASDKTVVRSGYSINYSSGVYQSIAQQLANQPPFVSTATVIAPATSPVPIETILVNAPAGTVLNNYAVDPNYRMPNVQIWNVDLQRDLTQTLQVGIGYTGTKGTNLDLLEAPNRTATGLKIPHVAPFVYETSSADSHMNSLSLRLRKRLSDGLAFSATYTVSKSIDDASSVAGAGGTVAQNPDDLSAERGLSNFDQRHQFNGNLTWELPFGERKRWFNGPGAGADILGNWVVNTTVQLASGTPYSALILGSASDAARGTNGTLRANYNGAPIAIADPTTLQFFNTAAFSSPLPGTYGNSGRNIIIGPGTSVVNLGVTKNFNFGQTRGLSIQLSASNLFNTVQYATIDAYVNSPTFGQVTSVRPMRRIQIQTRYRF